MNKWCIEGICFIRQIMETWGYRVEIIYIYTVYTYFTNIYNIRCMPIQSDWWVQRCPYLRKWMIPAGEPKNHQDLTSSSFRSKEFRLAIGHVHVKPRSIWWSFELEGACVVAD